MWTGNLRNGCLIGCTEPVGILCLIIPVLPKGKQKSPGRATSRSCSQPLTSGGREKVTQINVCKANRQMHDKHKDQLPLPQASSSSDSDNVDLCFIRIFATSAHCSWVDQLLFVRINLQNDLEHSQALIFLSRFGLYCKRSIRNSDWLCECQGTVLSAYSAHLRIWVEFKNVGWTKLKFYLSQNEEWLILNKKKYIFIKYLLHIY